MSSYVSYSNCRGHRPSSMASSRAYSRTHLIAQLIKERAVARFICAPFGYGKSSVALEYADVVFGFKHVFWFDATSPCFTRDLDAGTILDQVIEEDAQVKLAIFDDVPLLDPERAQAFSQLMDDMMERGCEVLVTCTPYADVYGALQHDRVMLQPYDLLLNAEEYGQVQVTGTRLPHSEEGRFDSRKIACFAWPSCEDIDQKFVAHLANEELPGEVLWLLFVLMTCGEGDTGELFGACELKDDLLESCSNWYPHLGIEENSGRFGTMPMNMDDVIRAFKTKMNLIVSASPYGTRNDMANALASMLVEKGDARRALQLVDKVCAREQRAEWLVANVREIARQGVFAETLEIIESLCKVRIKEKAALMIASATMRVALDDLAGAFECVKRIAYNKSEAAQTRMAALAIVARSAEKAQRLHAAEELEVLLNSPSSAECAPFWLMIGKAIRARLKGSAEFFAYCEGLIAEEGKEQSREGETLDEDALCIILSWLFDLYEGSKSQGAHFDVASCYLDAQRTIIDRMGTVETVGGDYFLYSAALALERAHMRGLSLMSGSFSTGTLMMLRTFEMSIVLQGNTYRRACAEREQRLANRIETHPDSYLYANAPSGAATRQKSIPTLTIRLFGRMEIWVGDTLVDSREFRRKATRELFAMLAVNLGRELPQQLLASLLWPDSMPENAYRNFYTIWSDLRHILSLSDGTCPYLTRHAFGCSIEPSHVRADVGRLAEICRELMFGDVSISIWSELFREIDRDFSDDLAPFESKNPLILQARGEYHARLVEALVIASMRVVEAGEPTLGVWFARKALAIEETREDAYLALMEAQMACGQRTAAMGTFMRCRKVLAESLGIDPSPEAQNLYERLLDIDRAA